MRACVATPPPRANKHADTVFHRDLYAPLSKSNLSRRPIAEGKVLTHNTSMGNSKGMLFSAHIYQRFR